MAKAITRSDGENRLEIAQVKHNHLIVTQRRKKGSLKEIFEKRKKQMKTRKNRIKLLK